jgi:hypothetical protein
MVRRHDDDLSGAAATGDGAPGAEDAAGPYLDYSKNRVTDETIGLLNRRGC